MLIATATDTPVTTAALPTQVAPYSPFEENHSTVVSGLRKTLEVMDALREIYEGEQWRDRYASFEAYCDVAAAEAGVSFGYKRAMQLIEAARRRAALSEVSTPVELPATPEVQVEVQTSEGPRRVNLGRVFKSEKGLRALPPQTDEKFIPVAELAVSEAQRRGMQNGPSEGLVKSVTRDIEAFQAHNLTGFEDVQRMFAPWGTFKRHTVMSRSVQRYRYQFEAPVVLHQTGAGTTKLFTDLREAIAFYQEWCLPSRRLKTVGCLTCQRCQVDGEPGTVTCTDGEIGGPVKLTEVWAKTHCDRYVPLKGGVVPTPIGRQANSPQHPLPPRSDTSAPKYTHSAGMLGHQGANGGAGGTNERYTPEYIWKPALEAWHRSQFDLDPATTDDSPIPAAVRYTKHRSGLLMPWDVLGSEPIFMWGNFPYSLNTQFVPRLERYWEEGWIDHAFILEKTDNRTGWYQTLLGICSAFCLIDHSIGHVSEAGEEEKGGFFGSTLFYLGPDADIFYDAYAELGPICQVVPRDFFAR
jgi:hypothetical protein